MRKKSKPLRGLQILVPRARKQAPALSRLLRVEGAKVYEIPFIEIRPPRSWKPLDAALKNLIDYDWLVLTSVNGVEALFSRMKQLHLQIRQLRNLKIAAIGPATKAAIVKRGLEVKLMPKEYVAEAVVQALRSRIKGKHVLLVRAAAARDVIPRELRKASAEIDVIEAYRTELPKGSRA